VLRDHRHRLSNLDIVVGDLGAFLSPGELEDEREGKEETHLEEDLFVYSGKESADLGMSLSTPGVYSWTVADIHSFIYSAGFAECLENFP
jgi:hypothetical protein